MVPIEVSGTLEECYMRRCNDRVLRMFILTADQCRGWSEGFVCDFKPVLKLLMSFLLQLLSLLTLKYVTAAVVVRGAIVAVVVRGAVVVA